MAWLSVIGDSEAWSHFQFGEFLVYIPVALPAGTPEERSPTRARHPPLVRYHLNDVVERTECATV